MQPDLNDWIGRQERREARLDAAPTVALAATLDLPLAPFDTAVALALPGLWHWLYFLPQARASELGVDGHPAKGGFLPPVPLPRRMWAGGRLVFQAPLCTGERVTRTSTVESVSHKSGRSGQLVFVTVRHELQAEGAAAPAIVEWQDLVYREATGPGAPAAPGTPSAVAAQFSRTVQPDAVMLFRYSALTFNSHRIHYDLPYATGEEHYPGLVVHGPLQATLLMDLLRRQRPDATVTAFQFKAVRPAFCGHVLRLCGAASADGRQVQLWAEDPEGAVTLQATAELA